MLGSACMTLTINITITQVAKDRTHIGGALICADLYKNSSRKTEIENKTRHAIAKLTFYYTKINEVVLPVGENLPLKLGLLCQYGDFEIIKLISRIVNNWV